MCVAVCVCVGGAGWQQRAAGCWLHNSLSVNGPPAALCASLSGVCLCVSIQGKTTAIREIARTLADELHKRVVIVDTSNEIGGDGDVPHPAIGNARRMQVADATRQHDVMVSAAGRGACGSGCSAARAGVVPPLPCLLLGQ